MTHPLTDGKSQASEAYRALMDSIEGRLTDLRNAHGISFANGSMVDWGHVGGLADIDRHLKRAQQSAGLIPQE